jgi:uncharacterized protein (TIGR03083 family)
MDLAALYADTQGRVLALVEPLDPATLATRVPGTPKWTIRELVTHVTGVCADLAAGNTEGAATERWTGRQVAARRDDPFPSVLAEWRDRAPALIDLLATPGQVDAAAFDLLTHEHDLRGALGLAGPSDPAAVLGVTSRVTGRVGHLVGKNGLATLHLACDECAWDCGEPGSDPGPSGRAPLFEWFRALFGRRSAAQILTYQWDGDPSPYFDLLNLFGPLPGCDVAEAGAPVPAAS